ncbi:MAG: hypothetical protein WC370_09350 [Dehalococcoidales bacterium]|jgi:hypothetical protein
MKHAKLLRIIGIALVLSLLTIGLVAAPAFALPSVTLSTSSGATGAIVNIFGGGFTPSTPTVPSIYYVYFSSQAASVTQAIGAQVTVFQTVATATADASGVINTTFTVPTLLTSTGSVAVSPGTYYVYVALPAGGIVTVSTFTVIGNPAITISPATGVAGTSVVINGTGFTASTILAFRFDTITVIPTAGQTSTLSTGAFSSTITVPSIAAGAHTITATAGSSTATATFTVSASPTLDDLSPDSGAAGIDVVITGSSFPASQALTFKLDATSIARKSGDSATRTSGIFITTVTIPTSFAAGAHTITVTAGGGSATATFTVTSSATLDTLSPASGSAGTDVTISGSSFPASTALIFIFDGAAVTPKSGDTAVRASGIFSSVITVPTTAAISAHTITVTAGTATASATFTVTASATTVSASADGNTVGSSVVIWGSGFLNNSLVTVTYDGTKITESTAGADGHFVTSPFQIPASAHGDHVIAVTDGVNTESVTFTLESTPPSVPTGAAPASGASLKKPYLFDWNDVTDASAPVKYELQIATDTGFSADSLVLNKTGLMESQYKLTEAEGLNLSSDLGVYYWRIRAVDAASNDSAWTSPGQFKVIKPFSYVGWPLWLTIAVGAVVFFLAGLWLGRRTAFSY